MAATAVSHSLLISATAELHHDNPKNSFANRWRMRACVQICIGSLPPAFISELDAVINLQRTNRKKI